MQVISKRTLKIFWTANRTSRLPLTLWYKQATAAQWGCPADIKKEFGTTVDFIGDNRVIFDIGGNKFRLVVHAAYKYKKVLIKFAGTHKEYDKINPETV